MTTIAPGAKTLGPQNGTIQIKSFKEGLLSKMGHDLTIDVKQWGAKLELTSAEPPAGSVEVDMAANSLTVTGPGDLSDKDKNEIRGNIEKDVLKWAKFPSIQFKSTGVADVKSSGGKGTAVVKGQLTLCGQTQPIELHTAFEPSGKGVRVHGEAPLVQSRWGVKAYKAPLGVIKVKDELKIVWDFIVS